MILRKKFFFVSITIALLTVVTFLSCLQPLLPRGENGSVVIHIAIPSYSATTDTRSDARFIHPDTQKLVLTVTAKDMSTLTETKTLSSGESKIIITLDTIPRGFNRKINIALYDVNDILLAEGSTITEIQQNARNNISITAIPVTDKTLVVGTASEKIPSSEKGKTRVHSVAITASGSYLASSYPSLKNIVFNIYNNVGKKVSANSANNNVFSLSSGTYYFATSMPTDYAGGTTIKLLDINSIPTVTVSFEKPTEPKFSLPDYSEIHVDTEINISAALGFLSYKWFLNDVVQTETENSLIVGSGTPGIMIPGLNTLTLVVQSSEVFYSANYSFKIIQ